jgi:hypothetical protein
MNRLAGETACPTPPSGLADWGAAPARPLTPPEIVQPIKQLRFKRLPSESRVGESQRRRAR